MNLANIECFHGHFEEKAVAVIISYIEVFLSCPRFSRLDLFRKGLELKKGVRLFLEIPSQPNYNDSTTGSQHQHKKQWDTVYGAVCFYFHLYVQPKIPKNTHWKTLIIYTWV